MERKGDCVSVTQISAYINTVQLKIVDDSVSAACPEGAIDSTPVELSDALTFHVLNPPRPKGTGIHATSLTSFSPDSTIWLAIGSSLETRSEGESDCLKSGRAYSLAG